MNYNVYIPNYEDGQLKLFLTNEPGSREKLMIAVDDVEEVMGEQIIKIRGLSITGNTVINGKILSKGLCKYLALDEGNKFVAEYDRKLKAVFISIRRGINGV